jgi:SAM-dependent MidA family methyltransferase
LQRASPIDSSRPVHKLDELACYRLAQEVKRLTLPGEMGERFQAMLLARDVPPAAVPRSLVDISQGHRL